MRDKGGLTVLFVTAYVGVALIYIDFYCYIIIEKHSLKKIKQYSILDCLETKEGIQILFTLFYKENLPLLNYGDKFFNRSNSLVLIV